MFYKFILLFTIVPLIELAILIRLGNHIGFLPTVLLVAFTGIAGVSLAKLQGLAIIVKSKMALAKGRLPSDSLIDGVLVLVGAGMLLTPGLLTDIAGFSLIIATPRTIIRNLLKTKFKDKIINIYYDGTRGSSHQQQSEYDFNNQYDDEDVIDIGGSEDEPKWEDEN